MARYTKIQELRARFPKRQRFDINDFLMTCPYSLEMLKRRNKRKNVMEWRQVGMIWKALECGNAVEAGEYFGKNHATVFHSLKLAHLAFDGYHESLAEKIYEVCESLQGFNLRTDSEDMNEIASAVLIERNLIEKFRKLAEL